MDSDPTGDHQPRLRTEGGATQLYIDGQPYLVFGGEMGNSSVSDPAEIGPMFERLRRRMHLNTVLAPVYWDRIKAEEGQFDLSLLRGAVEAARAHDLRLILLWFGTWKNSVSCYVPS